MTAPVCNIGDQSGCDRGPFEQFATADRPAPSGDTYGQMLYCPILLQENAKPLLQESKGVMLL